MITKKETQQLTSLLRKRLHASEQPLPIPHRNPVESRAKQYAPIQYVADNMTPQQFDALHRNPPKMDLRASSILDGTSMVRESDMPKLTKVESYRGTKCRKCGHYDRERGTDKCLFCYGPLGFKIRAEARMARKQRKRKMLQTLSLPQNAETTAPHVSLATHDGPIYQAVIRIPRQYWMQIGKPKRLDITSPMHGDSWLITRGDLALAGNPKGSSILVQLSAAKLAIPKGKRGAISLSARIEGDAIVVEAPDVDWRGTSGEQPDYYETRPEGTASVAPAAATAIKAEPTDAVVAQAEPAPTIHSDQTPKLAPLYEGEVGISVTKNGATAMAVRFAIPLTLIGAIGDPQRVKIEGTVHEGFKIIPRLHSEGLMVNCNTGSNVYISTGMGGKGIDSKHVRKQIKVSAVVQDGIIKVSGPCREWIVAAPMWRPEAEAPPAVRHLPANALSGGPRQELPPPVVTGIIANGNGHAQNGHAEPAPVASPAPRPLEIRPGETIATLKARLQAALTEAGQLKGELEARTGLEFRVTSTLGLLVK